MIGRRPPPPARSAGTRHAVPSPGDRMDPGGASAQQVGATLRQTREALGLTLDEMAQRTRIRQTHLASLEAGEVDKLPGATFVAGFMRIYARTLPLEDLEPVERFLAGFNSQDRSLQSEVFPAPTSSPNRPKVGMVIGGLLGLGAALFIYEYRFSTPSPEMPVPTLPAASPLRVGEENTHHAGIDGETETETETATGTETGRWDSADMPPLAPTQTARLSVEEPKPPAAAPAAPAVEPEPPAVEPEAPDVEPEAPDVEPEAPLAKPAPPVMEPEPARAVGLSVESSGTPVAPPAPETAPETAPDAPALSQVEIETVSIPVSVNGAPEQTAKADSGGFLSAVLRFFGGSGAAEVPTTPKPEPMADAELVPEPAPEPVLEMASEEPEPPAVARREPEPPAAARPEPRETAPPPAPPTRAVKAALAARTTAAPAPARVAPQGLPKPDYSDLPERVAVDTAPAAPGRGDSSDPRETILNRYPEKVRSPRDLVPASPRAISLLAREMVWVQIQDGDGEVLKDMVMQPNEIFRVPGGMPFYAALGSASAVQVRIGAEELPILGKPGEPVQELELTPEALHRRAGR